MNNTPIIGIVSLGLAMSAIVRADETPPTAPPPAPLYLYTLQTDSESFVGQGMGLVVGIVNAGIHASHKRFLAALESATNAEGGPPDFLKPLICPATPCGRVVRAKSPLTNKVLSAELEADPLHAARVVEMRVILDGHLLQVVADMYDASIGPDGAAVRQNAIMGNYITSYSKSLHAKEINDSTNGEAFNGKFGSKGARMHYWLGGSNPRVLREIDQSGELLAALRDARTSADSPASLNDYSQRRRLPTLDKVVAHDVPACKVMFTNYPVVKDLGGYLWLSLPGSAGKNYPMSIYIVRRCHYDR